MRFISPNRRIRWRRLALPVLLVGILLAWPAAAWAHPLGNFTVNRYGRLEVGAREIHILHIVDMAEIPAFQERTEMDADRDGSIGPAEEQAYLQKQAGVIVRNIYLLLNGQQTPLEVASQKLTFPPGQGGLVTLRLETRLVARVPDGTDVWQAEFYDDNYADRLGWREVIVVALPGAALVESNAPATDVSQELTNYPQDLLQSPLMANSAQFRFRPDAASAGSATVTDAAASVPQAKRNDPFAHLITLPVVGAASLLVMLVAAFGWGAAHAFSPGHGKTIVAAYLVGSRGTIKHAIFLGLTTTITHTAGVFALGFVTLFASQFIVPEKLYPWLGTLSGLVVVAIGLSLLRNRLRVALWPDRYGHDHHHHDHSHAHAPSRPARLSPVFAQPRPVRTAQGTQRILSPVAAAALAQPAHDHNHAGHSHDHDHAHGPHGHSHLPPGADGTPVTWRNLLALGISGGLLPCPSALVVMLAAIALDRVGLGLALIVAFSLGLASVLTGIGILLVHARKLFERIPVRGPLFRLLPVGSALFITVAGAAITAQALVQAGVVRF